MTQDDRLQVVSGILQIMKVLAEDRNSMADKRKVMSLFNDLMIKNVNMEQLQNIVSEFIEGVDNR
ncbi:hypothetical protein [Cetobacterium sp.]|uniref:hypothetical protein n=1 Tax=Cetobacterium sp. TaxID=2071632 RepID=UPI003F2C2CD5